MLAKAWWLGVVGWALALGCGGSDGGGGGGGPDSAPPVSGEADAGDDGPSLADRVDAAEAAAAGDPACSAIAPFYWQLGDADGAVADGSIGPDYTADTLLEIASGSKLVWGAYVVERFAGDLAAIDAAAMTMRSGYTSFDHCPGALTVQGCFQDGDNAQHNAADDDFYFYGGGHYQKYAIDLGLGAKGNRALAGEVMRVLGDEMEMAYWTPEPAAGVRMTPAAYARFLRRILARELAIGDHLGDAAVCTLPAACDEAHDSPVPWAWHYSYGHWVEDDPDGDGAFSSPGAFGFYPWIDASRTWYGLVARKEVSSQAYLESVACGHAIRRAFLAGAYE
jgi:CubicO group peptidase (beta-lactamase class C family)